MARTLARDMGTGHLAGDDLVALRSARYVSGVTTPHPIFPTSDKTAALPLPDGAFCRPNISPRGRRRRVRSGRVSLLLGVVALVACLVLRAPWYLRALLALPAAAAAVSLLQARRGTCVVRAAEGTFEHDDFSRTPAPDADVVRSRRVAAKINRDVVLIGIATGALAAATAWLR